MVNYALCGIYSHCRELFLISVTLQQRLTVELHLSGPRSTSGIVVPAQAVEMFYSKPGWTGLLNSFDPSLLMSLLTAGPSTEFPEVSESTRLETVAPYWRVTSVTSHSHVGIFPFPVSQTHVFTDIMQHIHHINQYVCF